MVNFLKNEIYFCKKKGGPICCQNWQKKWPKMYNKKRNCHMLGFMKRTTYHVIVRMKFLETLDTP